MSKTLTRYSLAVLAALGLAACTSTIPGAGTAVSSGQSSSTSRHPDVPRVARPLGVAAYQADPCKTVPQAAMASLGFTASGEPRVGQSASE